MLVLAQLTICFVPGVEGSATEAKKLVRWVVVVLQLWQSQVGKSRPPATSASPRTVHMSQQQAYTHVFIGMVSAHIFIGKWTMLRTCIHFDPMALFPKESNEKQVF